MHGNNHDDIYVIPILENYLIYSPLRKIVSLVDKNALFQLRDHLYEKHRQPTPHKNLLPIYSRLNIPIESRPRERKGRLRPSFLGILPTRSCNMSCAYCDFESSSAPKEVMPLETAAGAVDWMATIMRSCKMNTLGIHFFGGEPLCAPDVVDVVIHRGRIVAEKMGLAPHFEISTNGLCSDNTARFVGAYFNAVVLSLDGFSSFHDRHRPINSNRASFDNVFRTAKILSRTPVELCIRCCVSQENVAYMVDITKWFCANLWPSSINFETLAVNEVSQDNGLFPPDPLEFARNFFLSRKIAAAHGVDAIYAAAEIEKARNSFCPVGKDTVIVSPKGNISSCYLPAHKRDKKSLGLSIGKVANDGNIEIDMNAIQRIRSMITDKPKCDNCYCRWSCAGGCHVRNATTLQQDCEIDDFCIQTRLITAIELLQRLDLHDIAEDFINSDIALNKITAQSSDRLSDISI